MILQILDVMFTVYQNGLIIYLLQKQIPMRKHSVICEIAAVLTMSLYLLVLQHTGVVLPDWLSLLLLPFYVKFLSKENWIRCIFWAILDSVLAYGTLTLVSYAFPVQIALNGRSTATSDEVVILYDFLANGILTLVMTIITYLCKRRRSIGAESFLFILMLSICFAINECFFQLHDDNVHNSQILLGAASSFFLMICIMILYELMTDLKQKQRIAEMSLQTSTLISDYQRELKIIYTNMLAQQHDLRHRVTVAEKLLDSSDLSTEIREKLLQSIKPEANTNVYITGNLSIDAIIMAKSTTMQRAGIPFTFIEYPLQDLPIREADFCVLLGNLLDNAIEGTMRIPDPSGRFVKLTFARAWDTFLITCLNSANESSIRRDGDVFISSKEHPQIHGFGTQNMINTVENANGIIEFYVENGEFRVEITLSFPRA